MLIFQLVFAAIFTSIMAAIVWIGTKHYERSHVPESVFERVISWHEEIMANSQATDTLIQLQEWRDFVLRIPDTNVQSMGVITAVERFQSQTSPSPYSNNHNSDNQHSKSNESDNQV